MLKPGGRLAQSTASVRTDPVRLAALQETRLLDSPPRESFDRLTRLAVNFLDVPVAFICLVDKDRDFFLSQCGLQDPLASARQVTGDTFCHFAIQRDTPLLIPDTVADPVYRHIPAVESLGVGAYAAIPLRLQNGAAIGSFCLIDFQPHQWSERQVEVLADLAQLVTAEIELERSEAALKQTELRYSELFEEVPVGLYRTAPEGRFLDANPRMVALLGYPDRETLLATEVPSLYAVPADRLRWAIEIAKDGLVRDYEFRLRRRNGEVIWVRDTTRVKLDSDGKVLYYEGALEDISMAVEAKRALEASEDYFRALTEKSQDIITVLETDGTIRYESPSLFSILGFTAEELVGTNVFSYVHPEDASVVMNEFSKMLAANATSISARVRFRHKDGSWRTLDATATNLASHPPLNGIVVNSRDVTEKVELEEQVRQGSKMEAVGQLAGGVAHDFNNLLTSIRGTTELLLQDLQGEPAERDLKEIRNSADKAADLTRQLLAFSRRQVLQPRIVNLNDTIGGMRVLLERLIGSSVEVRLDLAPTAVDVTVDPNQIERVILNLALNSRDAMPDGGVLTIATSQITVTPASNDFPIRLPPGDFVHLAVCDTGAGIAAEDLPRIFEPFFTTKPAGQGTGLGLATVFGIVEQSKGYICAENRKAGGTAFHVFFRRSPSMQRNPTPVKAPSLSLEGKETILVVDDDEDVGRLAVRVLRRFGYEVLAANDADEALRISREYKGHIHLLLTDVVMPRVRGPELAHQLRVERPDTRVVYMSGYNEEAVAQHGAIESGAAFLEKPFELELLARTIRSTLDAVTAG